MSRLRSALIFVFGVSALAFGGVALAWWEATSSNGDTGTSSGSWGWGSFIHVFDNQAQLLDDSLIGPDPNGPFYAGCFTNNPNDGCSLTSFKAYLNAEGAGAPTPSILLTCEEVDANGDCPCGEGGPSTIDARFLANPTPPESPGARAAFCMIQDDKGNFLFNTATYCEVDVTVLKVTGQQNNSQCEYSRSLTVSDSGESVFSQPPNRASFVRLLPPSAWPDSTDGQNLPEPENVPNCQNASGKIPAGGCRLPVGLPLGKLCNNGRCLDRLLPASPPLLVERQVLGAKEKESYAVFRSCPGDVDGGAGTIACSGGNKKVEEFETDVVIECDGNYEPASSGSSSNEINAAGNNTTQFDLQSNCMPADIVEPYNTITVQGIRNGVLQADPVTVMGCGLAGDMPPRLRCYVDEQALAYGCIDPNFPNNTTGHLDEIRAVARVRIQQAGVENVVTLVATDDNDDNGFICTNLNKLP